MARIRTIKPAFFKHGDLFDAEKASGLPLRVAFAGLWTIADREGRFKWKPRDIKVDVLPYDDVDMADVLSALVDAGLIVRYIVRDREYGEIPTFSQHQHVNRNEPQSKIPAPSENIPARAKRVRKPSPHHEERKGKERNDISHDADASFEEFWSLCPRKAGKGRARKAFEKACRNVSRETLIAAMRRYAASREGQDAKFTVHPATWLADERWADDLPDAPAPAAQRPPHESWQGHAEKLIVAIGEGAFAAFFAQGRFATGPPARIRVATPLLREMIERKFGAALRRVFGEVCVDVDA